MLGDIGPGGLGSFLVGDNYSGLHDRLHVCRLGRGRKQRLRYESRYYGDLGQYSSEGDVLEHIAATQPHGNRSMLTVAWFFVGRSSVVSRPISATC